jgi:hypothetical protein
VGKLVGMVSGVRCIEEFISGIEKDGKAERFVRIYVEGWLTRVVGDLAGSVSKARRRMAQGYEGVQGGKRW